MHDFITALESEIADLERQIEATPTYAKLREAKRLLAMYRPSEPLQPKSRDTSQPAMRPAAASPSPLRVGSNREAIITAAIECLRNRVLPMSTTAVLDVVQTRGVDVGGAIPRNNLSSILSRSDRFISHGRAGWTLAEGNEKAGDDAPGKDASPALFQPHSAPVEPGGEVAHDNNLDDDIFG